MKNINCDICASTDATLFTQSSTYRGEKIEYSQNCVGFKEYYLCKDCTKLARKALSADPPVHPTAWIENLIKSRASGTFRCQITNLVLSTDDHTKIHHITLDHDVTTKEKSLAERTALVVSQMINDIKSDLTLDEFRNVVVELSKIITEIVKNPEYNPEEDKNININVLTSFTNWKRSNKPNPHKKTTAKIEQLELKIERLKEELAIRNQENN